MISYTLPTLHIVVLAAGFSARLGQPKALARVRGASLLQRTLRVLGPFATASKLIVVVPPRSSRYRLAAHTAKVDFVANPKRAAGLSSSVRAGLTRARYSAAILLLPVDLARLQRRDVARLISVWRGARRSVIARCVHRGQPGTPLILPRALYSRALAVTGDGGLREFVRGLPQAGVRLVRLPSAAWDIDTQQDLDRARRGRPS